MKLNTVFTPKYAAATSGTVGANLMNAAIVSMFEPSRVLLMIWRPGRASGRDDILPDNFRKATIEPVSMQNEKQASLSKARHAPLLLPLSQLGWWVLASQPSVRVGDEPQPAATMHLGTDPWLEVSSLV